MDVGHNQCFVAWNKVAPVAVYGWDAEVTRSADRPPTLPGSAGFDATVIAVE